MAWVRRMKGGALRAAILALGLALTAPLGAQDSSPASPTLQQKVEARLAEAGPGTRFGLVVASEDGSELVAIAPDSRFIPASNTKMFTTAAAFFALSGIDRPDSEGGVSVRLEAWGRGAPDVVLEGHGDARLSSAPDCVSDCLAALADAVAARARTVGDVIGDDSWFPDQRWSPGMSWNNIPTRSGTAASALTLDDNELSLRVAPTAAGQTPALDLPLYYEVENRAVTVPGSSSSLGFDRLPNSRVLRLTGTIGAGAEAESLRLGIDDPAHYAAWRLRQLLEARGVRVTGKVDVRHRPLVPSDDPAVRNGAPAPRPPRSESLASLSGPPVSNDLALINKASQNLHAELMLRRLGRLEGSGSIADGLVIVRRMIEAAGVPRAGWDLSDGSGMSTYNRAAPRSVVRLLRWIAGRPWGEAWRATLPVGGVDGTLSRRFRGTPLEGKIFAKTGTLNATSALSGYLIARSGRTLTFSSYANDIAEGSEASEAVDAALLLIADEN
ncbi:MAG TPA: D-alanyl-D-alanine carboxypeptidase/D-alanyl-D-alanine-endopeptidase [Allosphingosinicella sp.]|nr:D-alanyl-D-alanine carboxypeptidase/D-alanyl-D-alanine-endopeptidase [Allosphingosinicella sp.]